MSSLYSASSASDPDDPVPHPVFGSFSLPVEIDGVPKPSGIHNLSREGWNDDKCRSFLVNLAPVPRNLNYKDGLRVIHPLLQERFGDENIDLAIGILEELIEIDSAFPFPGCVYQRWKHDHLKRYEDYQLPHVPHTSTIAHRTKPTKALIEWRAKSQGVNFSTPPPNTVSEQYLPSSPRVELTPPLSGARVSSNAHLKSTFRTEYSTFISVGGKKATVWACPTPEQFHRNLWNPEFGGGGICLSMRHININEDSSKTDLSPQPKALIPFKFLIPWKKIRKRICLNLVPARRAVQAQNCYNTNNRKRHDEEPPRSVAKNVGLPRGASINGVFARKNMIVSKDEDIPLPFLTALNQPTADEAADQRIEQLLTAANTRIDDICTRYNLEGDGKILLETDVLNSHMETFRASPTPNLFVDSSFRYKWSPEYLKSDQENPPNGLATVNNITLNRGRESSLSLSSTSDAESNMVQPSISDSSAIVDIYFDNRPFQPQSPSCEQSNTSSSSVESDSLLETDREQLPGLDYSEHRHDGTGAACSNGAEDSLEVSDSHFLILQPKTYCPPQKDPPVLGNTPEKREYGLHGTAAMCLNEPNDLPEPYESPQISDNDLLILEPKAYCAPQKASRLRTTLEERPHGLDGTVSMFQHPDETKDSLEPYESRQVSDSKLPILEAKAYCPPRKASEPINILQKRQAEDLTRKETRLEDQRIENENAVRRRKHTQIVPTREPNLKQDSLCGFDGASDGFSHYPNSYDKQTTRHNNTKSDTANWLVPATANHPMELDRDNARTSRHSPSKPEPLQIRKQSSQVHIARSQQQLAQNQFDQAHYENPVYPPPPSSARNHIQSFQSHETHASGSEVLPGPDHSAQSSQSSHRGRYRSDMSTEGPSAGISTARSTVSNCKESYLSDATPEIMGNFVPINPLDIATRPATADGSNAIFHSSIPARKFPKVINPYEFEPSTPDNNDARQTSTGLLDSQDDMFISSPQLLHVKNARSEGNTLYTTRSPSPPVIFTSKPTSCGIQRSESSPTVSPLRFEPRCEKPSSPDLYFSQREDDGLLSRGHRGRQQSEDGYCGGQQSLEVQFQPCSPPRQSTKPSARSSPTRPSRMQYQEPSSYVSSRNFPRSPTKTLDNVSEQDEFYTAGSRQSLSPPPVPPKKRSRSPMKKMFGEHGWLGQSPNERLELKSPSKKFFPLVNGDFQGRKKTSMMGKLKNKLEEIAEKADLNPIFKSDYEKYSKLAMLSISLTPPEQAKVYMELELMLVHTANNFLMSQFSQGRIDVDSIKKTVDAWKSKGRPLVIEFMYDQGTQRELVVANQHNFRFHGPTAGSEVRISSMLYNWKQVASLMSVRTFCSADTVIMKILFDIEQVLELLGAAEPLMLRLQQIRSTANQNIRTARHNKEVKEATQNHPQTRQLDFNARNPDGSARYDPAKEEGYGGMKLVPDSYLE